MSEATSATLDLDPELHRQLVAEAEAENTTITEFLGQLLRDHVSRRGAVRDYNAWFDAEIEKALDEANDPLVDRIPDEVVRTDLERRITSLRSRT